MVVVMDSLRFYAEQYAKINENTARIDLSEECYTSQEFFAFFPVMIFRLEQNNHL